MQTVTALVGVPAADVRFPSHLGEPPVELVGGVGVAVLVAEDEVVVMPGLAGCPAFPGLPLLVGRERGDRALGKFQRALGASRGVGTSIVPPVQHPAFGLRPHV